VLGAVAIIAGLGGCGAETYYRQPARDAGIDAPLDVVRSRDGGVEQLAMPDHSPTSPDLDVHDYLAWKPKWDLPPQEPPPPDGGPDQGPPPDGPSASDLQSAVDSVQPDLTPPPDLVPPPDSAPPPDILQPDAPPPYCGDGTCLWPENCTTCPADCGSCPPPLCGNGVINPGEKCDGQNFGGLSCYSYGAHGGSLYCAGCKSISVIDCWWCGDLKVQGYETCEQYGGTTYWKDGKSTCQAWGYSGGIMGCDKASCNAIFYGCY